MAEDGRLVFLLAVRGGGVVEEERVTVVLEVAVAVVVAFHGLRVGDEHVLRDLGHAFSELGERGVDHLLDGGGLPYDALPYRRVAVAVGHVPCTFAVNREYREAVDGECGRLVDEVLVQHAVDLALPVVHAEVGHDVHDAVGLVLGRVDGRAFVLAGDPVLAVLGADPGLRAVLDDCSLDRVTAVHFHGIRVEIDVLHLLDVVEGGDIDVFAGFRVRDGLGAEGHVCEAEGHGVVERVLRGAGVGAELQERLARGVSGAVPVPELVGI